MDDKPLLDFEKLDVYRVALDLQRESLALLPERGHAALRDQLERAGVSVVLNIAEGAGRRSRPDKRRFYEIARGSAMEVAAIIDVLHTMRHVVDPQYLATRSLAVRVVQMLTKLCGS
jgi:four helix bundle protein